MLIDASKGFEHGATSPQQRFWGKLAQWYGFSASFLALGGVAAIAFGFIWVGVAETITGRAIAQEAMGR
jgi:hypothetical protein